MLCLGRRNGHGRNARNYITRGVNGVATAAIDKRARFAPVSRFYDSQRSAMNGLDSRQVNLLNLKFGKHTVFTNRSRYTNFFQFFLRWKNSIKSFNLRLMDFRVSGALLRLFLIKKKNK